MSLYESGCPDRLCVRGFAGQNGAYVFDEELDGKLVTEGSSEKKNSRPGELGEGPTPSIARPICGPRNN